MHQIFPLVIYFKEIFNDAMLNFILKKIFFEFLQVQNFFLKISTTHSYNFRIPIMINFSKISLLNNLSKCFSV